MPANAKRTALDIVFEVTAAGQGYQVRARGATSREEQAGFQLPFNDLQVENFLLKMGQHRRQWGRGGRVPELYQPMVDFGRRLYDALCCDEVGRVWAAELNAAQAGGYTLRLKLCLSGAPALADLPWEFLHDGRNFVALSAQTPLVRYLSLPQPDRPLRLATPLRMLATISLPEGTPPLDVQAERTHVEDALKGLREAGRIELHWLEDLSLRALQREMDGAKRQHRPFHIWHHIGHGVWDETTQTGRLLLCGHDGRQQPVDHFDLSPLFGDHPSLRLVVLNACEGARNSRHDALGGVAVALVESGAPAVIGMQFEISDQAAIAFAEGLYEALIDGAPVDEAVTNGRRAVWSTLNRVEWATPVLYLRARDAVLFEWEEMGKEIRDKEIRGRAAAEQAAREKAAAEQAAAEQAMAERKRWLDSLTPPWVAVPAGPFLMGSDPKKDKDARPDEQPQRSVYVSLYYITQTPITNAQFERFVQATGYRTTAEKEGWAYARTGDSWGRITGADWQHPRGPQSSLQGKEQHPVVQVSWHDAMAFCQWVEEQLALYAALPAPGQRWVVRLPTEAEWEKAARGSLPSSPGRGAGGEVRIYPWGDEPPDTTRCNFNMNVGDTTPVGSYPAGASPYGLLDCAGNVWEWCADWYDKDYYRQGPAQDPPGPASDGVHRALRGGGWHDASAYVRAASRNYDDPDYRNDSVGFRCVARPGG